MTDREIKQQLKNAYALPESLDEKRFIRKYEIRSLQLMEIIKQEFRYMGMQSIISGMMFTILMWAIAKTENIDLIWVVASMIPICAMVPMILLSRSERYGMNELEVSSRFSLRFIRLVRMFIVGIITVGLFIALGIIFRVLFILSGTDYLIMFVFPYLISDLGAMIVTRKWHRKDNVIGIFAVCIFCSIAPLAIREIKIAIQLPNMFIGVGIIALAALVIRECVLYVKESENISWNLC